ncbi:MAG: hypothetical protein IJ680_01470, partial [Paludibacteraceae bacterium]|nr:hypothetical protein [Paludibacteraceae bacterium]
MDALTERPVPFMLCNRYWNIYPPSLGISMLSTSLLHQLSDGTQDDLILPELMMLRMCSEKRDVVLRLVALHVIQPRQEVLQEERVQHVMKQLAP